MGVFLFPVALIASVIPSSAAEPLPKSGAAKLAAYAVCHSLAVVDMGAFGSQSSAECTGIVKTRDGDKLFMTYEGPESGPFEWIGGTGKYKDVVGSGTWSVADAPGNTSNLFAFTLSYDATWTKKEK